MADRTVYGHNFSENGWRMVDAGSCPWMTVPGTNVTLRIREGQPSKIMGAFAADFNAYVEPLRDADSACWTPTNSVATSNHLSGTGMDLNWNGPDGKTFRLGISKERAYPGPKAKALDDLIAFYEGMIFCGGNWSIRDFMHFQMGGNTYGSQHVEKVNDFIRRKVRADGFSTYKRTDAPTPPAPPVAGNAVDILARATGLNTAKATEILPTMIDGLKQAQCNSVNRIAMFIAQTGHESAGFARTEEYASGAAYEGRADLGNTQPGDGVRFKGRTWIQITGRGHYSTFSQWAHARGLVPTPTYFVDHPVELQDMRWAGVGAAWYWTEKRPMNSLVDAADAAVWGKYRGFEAVTAAINGGTNGLADRQNRYNRALALGDQLLALATTSTPQTPGDDMAQVPQEQWDRVYRELTQRHPSRSPLRHLGEGAVDTVAGFTLNADGHGHVQLVKLLASLGHPESLALLREIADADPAKHPDRVEDSKVAQAILADLSAPKTQRVVNVTAPVAAPADRSIDMTEMAATVTSAMQEVLAGAGQPVTNTAPAFTGTPGQIIGQVYDAIAALDINADLPAESKATLSALIGILQAKTETAK